MYSGGGAGSFGFLVQNVSGRLDTGVPIAASRAGAVGILNFEGVTDLQAAHHALQRLERFGRGAWGVKFDSGSPLTGVLVETLPTEAAYVVLTAGSADRLHALVAQIRRSPRRVFLEVTSSKQAGGSRFGYRRSDRQGA